jgi:hypothetical protein
VGGVLGVCLMIASLYFVARDNAEQTRIHDGMLRVMAMIKPKPDYLFVLWREWFPLEAVVYPLQDTRQFRDFRCLPMGVLSQTPFAEQRMTEYGIDDIYQAICSRPKVILIAMPPLEDERRLWLVQYYQQYMRTHYRQETSYRILLSPQHYGRLFTGIKQMPQFVLYQLLKLGSTPNAEQGEQKP